MGAISTSVTLQGPFDLPLSLDAAARFLPPRGLVPTVLKVAARFDRRPAVFGVAGVRGFPGLRGAEMGGHHRRHPHQAGVRLARSRAASGSTGTKKALPRPPCQ